MSWTERRTIGFRAVPNAHGDPTMVHLEFLEDEPSLLHQKQIPRIFFALRPGRDWGEVEALAKALTKLVGQLCIVHVAGGENG